MHQSTLALINAGIPMIGVVTGGVHSILDLTLLEKSDVPNVAVAVQVMPKTQPHVDRFDEVFKLVTDAGLVHQERFWQDQSLLSKQ